MECKESTVSQLKINTAMLKNLAIDEIEERRKLIQDETVQISNQNTTYVSPFMTEKTNENVILIYGKQMKFTRSNNTYLEDTMVSELDLTGSPLKYSFISENCDNTIVGEPEKHWLKEEQTHYPLSIEKARKYLSIINLYAKCWKHPVWIPCDGKDPKKTVLMSTFRNLSTGWLTRNIVKHLGLFSFEKAEEYAHEMKTKHISLSRMPQFKVKVCTTHVYDIHGSMRSSESKEHSLSVEMTWSSSSIITSPPHYADSSLKMLIVTDSPNSPSYKMWNQLKIINELLRILKIREAEKDNSVIEIPHFADNTQNTTTADVLNLINEFEYVSMSQPISKEFLSSEKLLNTRIQNILSGQYTVSHDFTHSLFSLLINCRNSRDVIDCLNFIFSYVKSGKAYFHIDMNNQTEIASILRRLAEPHSPLLGLTDINAIKLLVEIGLEKLTNDYAHMFVFFDLATLELLGVPTSQLRDLTDDYKKLDVLGRLHVALEILLLIESEMNLVLACLRPLARFTLKNIESQINSFTELLNNGRIKFRIPINTKDIFNKMSRMNYSTRNMQLTSEDDLSKVCSILYCSRYPVFPYIAQYSNSDTVISDETITMNEDVECSKMISFSNKLP